MFYLFFKYIFITIVFLINFFYSNAVHKFPVFGTIKCYCIVLYCKNLILLVDQRVCDGVRLGGGNAHLPRVRQRKHDR